MKGPAIFLVQFIGDAQPFDSFDAICGWAAGLGYKGVQVPTTDPRLIDLEARRVARLLRGELNRLFNAEAANLGRTVDSAARQLSAIQELGTAGRLAALPGETRAVAEARRDAPEATIGELAEATRLHRSAVQRELQRIERFAVEATVRPMEATGRPI